MAEPTVAQTSPIQLEVKQGEDYHWCTCGLSDKQPLCDGAHKGSEFKPLAFEAEKDDTVHLCGCKKTGNPPYCDGSHKTL
ncbi:MAG: CDGSH iron-sulfur domain-containing protein [Rhodospirillales bacterium]|nr:CDGSH iron-sulfur domain-containing protein [Rhodospirillales bacterium]MDP6645980.1 CDGSH iron-sulfur domain-containing protein [Rhodospirillales bacterium]MDP6842900.1 CDGSH iron-sulfur domain-containing protein [Rhodospirillales bacterium]